MSYLPAAKDTNVDVSFHNFLGYSSPYYTFSTPASTGLGVARPSSDSFVLSSGRSYWLRASISFTRGSNGYTLLTVKNQWELEGSVTGFKSHYWSTVSGNDDALKKNPTNRPEAVIFIPSSSISTSVTLKLKQVLITSNNGNTSLIYGLSSAAPCGCVVLSVPD